MVSLVSTSSASDLGYLALADLSLAAKDVDHRVVGGHMVALLLSAYPVAGLSPRATLDADAGIDTWVASESRLHEALLTAGYRDDPHLGNRYIRSDSLGDRYIDVLLPSRDGRVNAEEVAGRVFSAIPGLRLAVTAPPLMLRVRVRLRGGAEIEFDAMLPGVEEAVVLKACAWSRRSSEKDVADLATLFEIVHQHKKSIRAWSLHRADIKGARLDAIRALNLLRAELERGRYRATALPTSTVRMNALITEYVCAR